MFFFWKWYAIGIDSLENFESFKKALQFLQIRSPLFGVFPSRVSRKHFAQWLKTWTP